MGQNIVRINNVVNSISRQTYNPGVLNSEHIIVIEGAPSLPAVTTTARIGVFRWSLE